LDGGTSIGLTSSIPKNYLENSRGAIFTGGGSGDYQAASIQTSPFSENLMLLAQLLILERGEAF
jgi:hypothetical protein